MIVVDANVIAYFVIRSEWSPLAEALLKKDREWTAPLLWKSELRSALTGYLRRKSLSEHQCSQAMQMAETQIHEFDVSSERVFKSAINSSCSAYDCEYVALADELNVPLVTADKKICAAFPKIAISLQKFSS